MKFTFAPESKPLAGYTIKRAIYRGGFGEVYYGVSDSGKEVALKLLHQNSDVELRGVQQCLNLKHPNLVTIFDILRDRDGDHWIVMEYVSGRTLQQLLDQQSGSFSVEQILDWLHQTTAGLSFLHDRSLVHRDIKPSNIFVERGIVKIGDVGLTKFISGDRRSTHTQSVGTVYYMAPEVAHGKYGREVDVYSLGVILYEMLAGRVPFDGESTGEILMKHLTEQPDLGPIPERFRPVISAALEKDPQQRIHSVKELDRRFRQAAEGATELPPVRPAVERPVEPVAASRPAFDGAADGRAVYGNGQRPSTDYSARRRYDEDLPEWMSSVDAALLHWWWVLPVGFLLFILMGRTVSAISIIGFSLLLLPPTLIALGYAAIRFAWYIVTLARREFLSDSTRRPQADAHQMADERRANPVPPRAPVQQPVQRPRPKPLRERQFSRHVVYAPSEPRAIGWSRRLTELTGAMTLAVFCTLLATGCLAFFSRSLFTVEFPLGGQTELDIAAVGFFALSTLWASWCVLTLAKLTEGRKIDRITKRVCWVALGCLIGAGVYYLDEALLVPLPVYFSNQPDGFFSNFGDFRLMQGGNQPTLAGYMVFFGLLFGLRRWWWHADSFRPFRFRLLSVIGTVCFSYLLLLFWSFSATWGIIWAATISCVVQLSAPWTPQNERAAVMESAQHEL